MPSELVVHTVPSWEPGLLARRREIPFRRIVGMDIGDETVWVAGTGDFLKHPEYDPEESASETLQLSDGLALKVKVFFRNWLASSEIRQAGSYNCHSFADFASVGEPESPSQFSTRRHILAARQMVAGWAEATQPLEMGQHGVIADERAKPLHSVIGLGEDNPECLQVTQVFGSMALDRYDAILDYYNTGNTRHGEARLYARARSSQPIASPVSL